MDHKPTIKNIYQRMVEVQKKVLTVLKNEKIEMKGERGYKGVTHDDVAALLHLPLAESGIVLLPDVTEFKVTEFEIEKTGYNGKYIQKWYRTDMKILVKWINADDPKDFIQSTGGSFALDTSDKGFAKAYSLALKIVLLKVHLLESKDGEEQREFEKDLPGSNQKKQSNPPPPAQPQPHQQQQSQPDAQKQRVKINNFAPAPQDILEKINDLAIQRGVQESELNYLVNKGYASTTNPPYLWIANEIVELLENESCNSATVMAQAQKVLSRREAARIMKEQGNKPPASQETPT